MTLSGALYIAITLFFGFAAVNTGNNLLYLLVSALLGFMVVSGIFGHQNLKKIEVKIKPGLELFAGISGTSEAQIFNLHAWLPVFLIRVELGDSVLLLPVLTAGQSVSRKHSLCLPKRGYQQLPQICISSCFPVNFFVRTRRHFNQQALLVFPYPLKIHHSIPSGTGRQTSDADVPLPGNDGELRSIDNYRTGDSLKAIHWKLSARHQDLKVKHLNRQGAAAVVLNLDELPGSLEERLSRCTYLINHYHLCRQAVGLQLPDKKYPPDFGTIHKQKLLTALALYDQH